MSNMSPPSQIWTDKAIQSANQAVEADNAQRHKEAIKGYMKAAKKSRVLRCTCHPHNWCKKARVLRCTCPPHKGCKKSRFLRWTCPPHKGCKNSRFLRCTCPRHRSCNETEKE